MAISAEDPGGGEVQVQVDAALVGRLLAAQFPHRAGLPVQPFAAAGTDNFIFRLGDGMAVRLPRLERSVAQVEKEYRWLPTLAPALPLRIPTPLALGRPGEGYPWPWGVYRWLAGEPATVAPISDPARAAAALGRFIAALQGLDPAGGPPGGPQNGFRGVPLAVRAAETRRAIASLRDTLDTGALTAAWDAALGAPLWPGAPVWLHGDIHAANLLVRGGRISAVIDFGLLGVGDPACDLTVAWTLLTPDMRGRFRAALPVDDATWARGRGWALAWGLIAFAYYRTRGHVLADLSRRAIDAVLADQAREG